MPKVSIVLPNMNGAGWLEGCIQSLYSQSEQDFELIIIDNGSTDESLEAARKYAKEANCLLVENEVNTGFSAAVNKGISLSKSPYILLFNNDAFAKEDMVEKLLAKIEENPRFFSVQSHMLRHFEPEKTDDAGDYMSIIGWAFKRGDGLAASRYTKECRVFSSCGGAALYRKSILDEIGGFEEIFFAYLEDVDIGWRANSLGYINWFCPEAVCSHICGATTSGTSGNQYNDFKTVQSGRNNLLLPYKNMPIIMFILNLIFLLPGYLLKMLVFHVKGYGKSWRQGMLEGIRSMKKIKKPKFKFKNLPHYLWVEFSMLTGMFKYINYRVRRMFV